jgi:hypothetical protein
VKKKMEKLRTFTTDMHEGMVNGNKRTEDVIKINKRKNYEGMEEELQTINNCFIKHKKMAKEMENEVNKSEKIWDEYRKRTDRLEKIVEKLQPQVDELMKKNGNLEIARITNNFGYGLAAHIYPPHTKVMFDPIFANLMLWLDESKDTPEGREGNRKWRELKKEFIWSDEHEKVFYKMLTFSKTVDHQKVDFQSTFTDREKRYVDVIRRMSEQLN